MRDHSKLLSVLLLVLVLVSSVSTGALAAAPQPSASNLSPAAKIPVTPMPVTDIISDQPGQPIKLKPDVALMKPINVAFSAIANRYQECDPSTVFDLNGDFTGDLSISASTVTGKNGTQIQLLEPAVSNLDGVNTVPAAGYAATAPTKLGLVYVAKLSGGYAKFTILSASPKVTLWFHFGSTTTSLLKPGDTKGHVVLTWDALPDAVLGYNIYRYELLENNAYTVTLLNDFTVKDTTFSDNTVKTGCYYIYVVVAIKSNGAFGTSTTTAPV